MIKIRMTQYGKEVDVYVSTWAIASIELTGPSVVVRLLNGHTYVALAEDAIELIDFAKSGRMEK